MTPDDLQFITALIKKRSGIALGIDKAYLLESRLQPIARGLGLADVNALIQKLRHAPSEALLTEITEAMTTNESLFFRDNKPFDALRKHLIPEFLASGKKSLRIWSAACSTGQEPYSIAMCLLEEGAKMAGINTEIVGTDLAGKVLERAQKGLYTQFEAQRGLSIQLLLKYFDQQENNQWQVKSSLRSMVKFQPHNLLESYSALGAFDWVFCRNVLIYFDDATKTQILNRIADAMPSGGTLLLGGSETIIGLSDRFTVVDICPAAFRKK